MTFQRLQHHSTFFFRSFSVPEVSKRKYRLFRYFPMSEDKKKTGFLSVVLYSWMSTVIVSVYRTWSWQWSLSFERRDTKSGLNRPRKRANSSDRKVKARSSLTPHMFPQVVAHLHDRRQIYYLPLTFICVRIFVSAVGMISVLNLIIF